ncbi:hypothetical protein BpHYR1_045766 [Brachionus plicatilis]|uniref:Uncharacterized protein n=1 Tax=Brachionus plicatilis TaxID=10195 RepID=A0A3M7RDC5_BRAPC|nr:hypothetical protein BpHYR1_045766 [Brachionus plicatilis]
MKIRNKKNRRNLRSYKSLGKYNNSYNLIKCKATMKIKKIALSGFCFYNYFVHSKLNWFDEVFWILSDVWLLME